jgi:inward rectifier potassium channel
MRKKNINDPIILGVKANPFKDFYYFFMGLGWFEIFGLLLVSFLVFNFSFAALFYFIPATTSLSAPSFLDCFNFSVQTMSTIGYGGILPVGALGNTIVTIEAAFGIVMVAILTGLIFAKISKPNAKIIFSKNMLIQKMDGQDVLTFRLGNVRGNDIVEASVKLTALLLETPAGQTNTRRRLHDLKVIRSNSAFFRLTWSIYHPIDEDSPFYGKEKFQVDNLLAIVATVIGHDDSFSSTIHARHNYYNEHILINKEFEDVLSDSPNGQVIIDYAKFHSIK